MGDWIGALWSVTRCTQNGLGLLPLPELSAIITSQISEMVILPRRVFCLKKEKKSGSEVFLGGDLEVRIEIDL